MDAHKSHTIIVFGGQGRTGSEVVMQALAAGHHVSAFTYRDNHSLPAHQNLRIIEGDARNPHDVSRAIKGHDMVINIVAPRLGDSKNYDISVVATRHIIAGMQHNGVKRYWGQCGAWATENLRDASIFMQLGFLFFLPLKHVYKYKKQEDGLVKKSGLDWTIVRAPLLNDGPLAWPVRVFVHGYKCKFYEIPKISRKSVAKFYVENLDNSDLIGTCPVILP